MINAYETSGTSPSVFAKPTETPWLTSREAANYLRVEHRTILQWARQGHIKGHVLSGTRRITWRFLRSDLDAVLKPCGNVVAPTVALNLGGVR
jgi:excisionase family DNA binding protein